MVGLYLNVILFCLGTLALTSAISFYVQERECGYYRTFIFSLGIFVFLVNISYAVMGIMPNIKYAFIPRFIGVFSIGFLLIVELIFLMAELKLKKTIQAIVIGFFSCYALLDLIIFGNPATDIFIRYDFYTAYKRADNMRHLFHYSYILIIGITLFISGLKWYKSKTLKRDKLFVFEIIIAESAIFFATLPDIFKLAFAEKYPTFSYCVAFAVVYFALWFGFKRHILFTPTVKNVSQEIFNSIDVPLLIFSPEGKVELYNPCAKGALHLAETFEGKEANEITLRSIFTLTDVDTLRILALAKQGKSGRKETLIKATQESCTLSYSVKLDNSGEPFCIICTVLMNNNKEVAQ